MVKKLFKKLIKKWNEEEDTILNNWVTKNGPKNWKKCSKLLKNRTSTQCRERWKNSLDPKIKKGDWNQKEDLKLYDLMLKNLFSWKQIATKLPGRTRISCRNRFYNSIKSFRGKVYNGIFMKLILHHEIYDIGKIFKF